MARFREVVVATLIIGILVGVCAFQEAAAFATTSSVTNVFTPVTEARR